MQRLFGICAVAWAITGCGLAQGTRGISYHQYLDKIHGGWTGKALGLAMGVPKEYSEPWPPSEFSYFAEVPDHFSDRASGDDIYCPLVFQLALQRYGIHPTPEQYFLEWDRRLFSGRIWGSLEQALDHYRAGLPPSKTGLPGYNRGWDDMGAQMCADIVGWITPGLPNIAARMADHLARIMSSETGAHGAVMIGALESEAFFTNHPSELVLRAQSVLPPGSRFIELANDLMRWRKEQSDWRIARQMLAKKYNVDRAREISGLLQGGVVILALLYGDGDFEKSLLIAQKCGWDSDTNASTVGGILGTMHGFSSIPPKWRFVLHDTYENYCVKGLPRWMTFSDLARDTLEIGERVIQEYGGQVSGSGVARRFLIPIQSPLRRPEDRPVTPQLIEENHREMLLFYRNKLKGITNDWNPAWQLTMASFETLPAVLPDYMGRKNVLRAQPGPNGAILEGSVSLAAGKHHYLRVGVAHHPTVICQETGAPEIGSWRLEVRVNGKSIGSHQVRTQGGLVVWEDPQFDLTPYAGTTVQISLVALQTSAEFYRASMTSYWSSVELWSLDTPEPWR